MIEPASCCAAGAVVAAAAVVGAVVVPPVVALPDAVVAAGAEVAAPPAVVAQLRTVTAKILAQPELQKKFEQQGAETVRMTTLVGVTCVPPASTCGPPSWLRFQPAPSHP